MKFDTLIKIIENKDYKIMISHKDHSTEYYWLKWDAEADKWKIDFNGKIIELPDIKDISKYGFSIAGGSSGSGGSGEVIPYPKNIVKAGRALEDK